MDARQLEDYSARLDATGLKLARKTSVDGANVSGIEELPWHAVLVRILRDTGWVVVDNDNKVEADVIPLHLHLHKTGEDDE